MANHDPGAGQDIGGGFFVSEYELHKSIAHYLDLALPRPKGIRVADEESMPVRLATIRSTDTCIFEHYCEVCGERAPFGVGVEFKKALHLLEKGQKESCKRFLGQWYCLIHWGHYESNKETKKATRVTG